MPIKQLEKKIRSLNLNLYGICEYENGKWEKITLKECNPKNHVYSVSKSVTSLVAGILIGEGVMSLEDHVTEVLGELADFPPGWEKVTVRHLLTHSTGFIPMEIMGTAWATCPKGYAMGATGLYLGVEDMAKLGVLILHHGSWKGRQLVPAFWTEEMRKKHIVTRHSDQDYYGYGIRRRSDTDASLISGSRGQRILVFHDREYVVAWQGYASNEEVGPLINEVIRLEKG